MRSFIPPHNNEVHEKNKYHNPDLPFCSTCLRYIDGYRERKKKEYFMYSFMYSGKFAAAFLQEVFDDVEGSEYSNSYEKYTL